MMRKKAIIMLCMMLIVLAIAAPATATRPEPVGDRLSIFPGNETTTFDAGKPFNISHGWSFVPPEDIPGSGLGFDLWVDDVFHEADMVYREAEPGESDGASIAWSWVNNFPEGMTAGTHKFRGEWFASCSYAVDLGLYTGPCSAPNEKVVTMTNQVYVDFIFNP